MSTPTTSRVIEAVQSWAATDRIALRSFGRAMTYNNLLATASALAGTLGTSNVRVLGIALDNGIEWCIADLAAIIANIATVPIPPFFTESQRQYALKSAGADALLLWDKDWQLVPLNHRPITLPAKTAKITYTSGTTGNPKGVCLSQEGMETVASSLVHAIGAENAQCHLAILPLGVLLENIGGLYATLLAGGIYVVESMEMLGFKGMRPDGKILLRYVYQHRITSCILVPEFLQSVMDAMEAQPLLLPDLCFIAVGGAKVSESLLDKAHVLGLPVYQGYGLSESASVVAVNTPSHHRVGSVGKVLPHIACRINEQHELILQQPALLGYVGGHCHTEEYGTGDLVRMDGDGFLFIEGRMRNVIITSHGRNISPEWPESELLAQPEIAQAVVVGEAMPHLCALIVPAFAGADIASAVQLVNRSLPEYARIERWHAVAPLTPADGLLTPSGRPVRDAVQRHFCALIDDGYQLKEA